MRKKSKKKNKISQQKKMMSNKMSKIKLKNQLITFKKWIRRKIKKLKLNKRKKKKK